MSTRLLRRDARPPARRLLAANAGARRIRRQAATPPPRRRAVGDAVANATVLQTSTLSPRSRSSSASSAPTASCSCWSTCAAPPAAPAPPAYHRGDRHARPDGRTQDIPLRDVQASDFARPRRHGGDRAAGVDPVRGDGALRQRDVDDAADARLLSALIRAGPRDARRVLAAQCALPDGAASALDACGQAAVAAVAIRHVRGSADR